MTTDFSKRLGAALLAATCLTSVAAITAPAYAAGVLRLDESAPGDIDPASALDNADTIMVINLYDTLVLPAQGEAGYEPLLATGWEASEDGLTYTFTLRDDVSFQSGNPLTAADVVFSLERIQALGMGVSYLFDNVASAEAVDEHTVAFTLAEPSAPFLASLVRLGIVDSETVMANLGEGEGEMGDWGRAYLGETSAGTGAYSVVSHNPQEETVMAKNADYFLGIDESAPDEVRLRYSLEPATVRTLISQGEHDIASQWLPPEVTSALASNGAQLLTESGGGAFYTKLNTQKPPLDDVNCRRALQLAFDYESALRMIAITDDVSQGSLATGLIPVGLLGARGEDMAIVQDMDAARAALAECQYDPADYTLEISWIGEVPLEERFALLMQANFTQLGFDAEIRRMPWALFAEQATSVETTPHISQVSNGTTTGDPDTLLYNMYHSSAAGTWASPEWLNNPEVDALLDAGRTETDLEARNEIYSELNELLVSLAPSINMYDTQQVYAASTRVDAPTLSDPSQAYSVSPFGFTFRLMSINE